MFYPLISVVMPVFNADIYLRSAIESVLGQTFREFEFIIINDGSTDGSLDIITSYAAADDRIQFHTKENQGLSCALNDGISLAKGKWIARMDADDISLPTRFSEVLRKINNTDFKICGSWIELFDSRGSRGVMKYPLSPEAIKYALLFGTAFAHPAVFLDAEVAKNNQYDPNYDGAEDYELWTRLAAKGCPMTNVQFPTLKYRIHQNQASKLSQEKQHNLTQKIKKEYWKGFRIDQNQTFKSLENLICNDQPSSSGNYFKTINSGFVFLDNSTKDVEAKNEIKKNWWITCVNYASISVQINKNWTKVMNNFSFIQYVWGVMLFNLLKILKIHKSSQAYLFAMKIYLKIHRLYF
jgi:glycosyltransferase involved in cell wall biosynthesis